MSPETLIAVCIVVLVVEAMALFPLGVWMGWRLSGGMNPAPPVVRAIKDMAGMAKRAEPSEPKTIPAEQRMNA
jgi:hypothetical protein